MRRVEEEAPESGGRLALAGVVAALIVGTVARLALGLQHRPWMGGSDQYLWGLFLQEPGLRLDQLVHFPHEGGSLVLGSIALWIPGSWEVLPPLATAALLWDTLCRAIQIAVVWRVLGARTGAWFTAWTCVAVPGLLPWAVVNPNLHASACAWPFVILFVVWHRRWLATGILAGASVAFAYDNLVLLPVLAGAALLGLRAGRITRPQLATACGGAAAVMGAHLAFRAWAPLGYELEALSPVSVRGVDLALGGATDSWWAWYGALPEMLFTSPYVGVPAVAFGVAWLALAIPGAGFAARGPDRAVSIAAIAFVCAFLVVYAAGPFAVPDDVARSYYNLRHLTYVVPSLAALGLHGLCHAPGLLRVAGPACLVSLGAVPLWWASPPQVPPSPIRSVGWQIARKIGHDPARVQRLVALDRPERAEELLIGVGWGTAAFVLTNPTGGERMRSLLSEYAPAQRPELLEGVAFAYAPDVTPKLPGRMEDHGLIPWRALRTEGPLVHVEPRRVAFYGNGRVELEVDGAGPLLLVVSGTPAHGRGPRLRLLDGEALVAATEPLGAERSVLRFDPVGRVVLEFTDDDMDPEGHDRNLFLWWAEREAL